MLSDDQINKDLHEKVMGECWHDHDFGTCPSMCSKCKKPNRTYEDGRIYHPSYTSNPSDYWRLLQKVKSNMDKWRQLEQFLADKWVDSGGFRTSKECAMRPLFDTHKGSLAIHEFFC